jgi:hypothetical protein
MKLTLLYGLFLITSCSKFSLREGPIQDNFLEKKTNTLHLKQKINLLIMIDYEIVKKYPGEKIQNNLQNFTENILQVYDARIALTPLNNRFQFKFLGHQKSKRHPLVEPEQIDNSIFFDYPKKNVPILAPIYNKLIYLAKDEFFRSKADTIVVLLTPKDDYEFQKDMFDTKLKDKFETRLDTFLELNRPFLNAALQEERFYQFNIFRLFSVIPFSKCPPFYRSSPKLRLAARTIERHYLRGRKRQTFSSTLDLCQWTVDAIFSGIFQELNSRN